MLRYAAGRIVLTVPVLFGVSLMSFAIIHLIPGDIVSVLAGPMVRRAIFVVDEEGVVRHRKVTLAGLTYESVDDLERAVASIG